MSESLIDMGDGPDGPGGAHNAPEVTVSELSGRIKRTLEDSFGRVRVRGEVGRVSRPKSGHIYLDLKDDRAVLASVIWRGAAANLKIQPEEGMEVIAEGRLTTFPGQSRYQLIIDSVTPAGAGALMAMLEARRKALAGEGLFDDARKRPIPFLPEVIGVVTSPSGAVIRDILHRLADRFPRHVLVWPVAVQGERCAPEVVRAIRGFNAIPAQGGPVPRPDVLIVARGGGSIEDLWGFNEESVVRAAAESEIPLISAVGHETDTTLIDFAADRRAPTPTAAAEIAVPVRGELLATLTGLEERRLRAGSRGLEDRRARLRDLARALPRPQTLTEMARQRLDYAADRLPKALLSFTSGLDSRLGRVGARLSPSLLARRLDGGAERLTLFGARLAPALERAAFQAGERYRSGRFAERAGRALELTLRDRRERLGQSGRMLETLSYKATLARGFAAVRGANGLAPRAAALGPGEAIEIEFLDGRVAAVTAGEGDASSGPTAAPSSAETPKRRSKPSTPDDDGPQGSLF